MTGRSSHPGGGSQGEEAAAQREDSNLSETDRAAAAGSGVRVCTRACVHVGGWVGGWVAISGLRGVEAGWLVGWLVGWLEVR